MKKLDLAAISTESGCNYPAPFDRPCLGSTWKRLGNAVGLTQFGVNLSRLPPGVWSSQRHWHSHEDELVYLLEGELISITDDGEEVLRAGDCIAFKAGDPDGHHLVNRSSRAATARPIRSTNLAPGWWARRLSYPEALHQCHPGRSAAQSRDLLRAGGG